MGTYKPGRPNTGKPPKARGEYRLITRITKKIVYIGISDNLARRKNDHKRSGFFRPWQHIFVWQRSEDSSAWDDVRKHEKRSIEKHKPRRNKNRGGGGRTPSRR